jgi:hypothetical protein
VLELDANAKLVDSFAPSDWAANNQGDVGLGSQGVALIGTKWAVLGGKSGPVYVLRQGHLGIGGQADVKNICLSFGGAAVDGDIVYLPCTDGVRAVRVDGAGQLHVLWHTSESVTGSPVIGGGRVWALDTTAGVLHALDPPRPCRRAPLSGSYARDAPFGGGPLSSTADASSGTAFP